jgi:hypothetical protein
MCNSRGRRLHLGMRRQRAAGSWIGTRQQKADDGEGHERHARRFGGVWRLPHGCHNKYDLRRHADTDSNVVLTLDIVVGTVDGELYLWGWNVYGQCGLGLHVENQLTPVLVEQLRGNTHQTFSFLFLPDSLFPLTWPLGQARKCSWWRVARVTRSPSRAAHKRLEMEENGKGSPAQEHPRVI